MRRDPTGYKLRSGDVLSLYVFGESETKIEVTLDAEGLKDRDKSNPKLVFELNLQLKPIDDIKLLWESVFTLSKFLTE